MTSSADSSSLPLSILTLLCDKIQTLANTKMLKNVLKYIYCKLNSSSKYGATLLDVVRTFPDHAPFSSGSYIQRALLTTRSIALFPDALYRLILQLEFPVVPLVAADEFMHLADLDTINTLEALFVKELSDKSIHHDYHKIYGSLFDDPQEVESVVEIGIGTNSKAFTSHMPTDYVTGGSLRAFSHFFPNSTVFGLDIDRKTFFTTERIQCMWIDQMDASSFNQLDSLPQKIDLLIDDGLHCPLANLNTLIFALRRLSDKGILIIEDIGSKSLLWWRVIGSILRSKGWSPTIVKAKHGYLFVLSSF